VQLANPAALALLSHPSADTQGRRLCELAGGAEPLLSPTGGGERAQAQLVLRDGRHITVGYQTSETGAPGYRAVVFRDLAPLVEAERRRRRAEQLAEAGELAAHIGHDVKNALATILATLQYLESGEPSPDQAKITLRHGQDEVRRLSHAMQNLLVAARPAALLPRPVQVGGAMREVLEQLTCARTRRVRLNITGADDTASVILDTVGLRRVVLNLLLNALDAAPIGSAVRIGWRQLTAQEAAARFPGYPGGVLCLSVSDEGPGIPAELLPRVVEPFFTTKPTGTGLGLAVVSQIVGAHGGILELASRPGAGTRVDTFLPSPRQAIPCWEARGCQAEARDACRVWREGTGFGCWNFRSECLRLEPGVWPDRCLTCPVYRAHSLAPYAAQPGRGGEPA
jgi:two-component system sensor histidine kinase HydH